MFRGGVDEDRNILLFFVLIIFVLWFFLIRAKKPKSQIHSVRIARF